MEEIRRKVSLLIKIKVSKTICYIYIGLLTFQLQTYWYVL